MKIPVVQCSHNADKRSATFERETVIASEAVMVERLHCSPTCPGLSDEEYSPEFQFVVPVLGGFLWHIGRDELLADPNKVIYITGGEAYRISHPIGSDECLIITPSPGVVEEIAMRPLTAVKGLELFRRRQRTMTSREQLLTAWLWTSDSSIALETEERAIGLISQFSNATERLVTPTAAARRTARRTREVLHQGLRRQLTLGDVSKEVGISAPHLTTLFRSVEGMPLYSYYLRLKMVAALSALRDTDDITSLALDLGFSSHSHFTNSFRQAFGVTPSAMRESLRRSRRRRSR